MTEADVERALLKLDPDDQKKARSVLDAIDAATRDLLVSPVGCLPDIEFLPPVVYNEKNMGLS